MMFWGVTSIVLTMVCKDLFCMSQPLHSTGKHPL